mmetsp:Transcript_12012/g.19302  ORF Transcript_12012/g.19302 Transcript_12012/m.19302 type:complete len:322 (-) Transcript_12012:502-1467(-)
MYITSYFLPGYTSGLLPHFPPIKHKKNMVGNNNTKNEAHKASSQGSVLNQPSFFFVCSVLHRSRHGNVIGQHLLAAALNTISHHLHWQDTERLFKLHAELLDAEQEGGDEGRGGHGGQVQVAVAQFLVQRQRQAQQPDVQEARGVPRVHQRNGRLEDALHGPEGVAEPGEVLVDLLLLDGRQVGVAHRLAQQLHDAAGAVGGGHHVVGLLRAQQGRELPAQLLRLGRPVAEVPLEHAGKADDLVGELGLLGDDLRGVGIPIIGVVVAQTIAHKVAAAVDGETPQNPSLPPSIVGIVGPKDKQETQGRDSKSKREGRSLEDG